MRRLVVAAIVLFVGVGITAAEEFGAVITKVDGNKVTFKKFSKDKKSEEMTLPCTDSVKVVTAKFNKETKKAEAGDAIEGGLKADTFTKIGEKGVFGTIVTDDDGKNITEIRVFQFGKKGKDKKKTDQ
jgi:hypothetical protein